MKKRNQYSAEFKAQVVLEVPREESTINEIAGRHNISPVMLSKWMTEFIDRAASVFKKGPTDADKELQTEKGRTAQLERKIGRLTYEVDQKNLKNSTAESDRKAAWLSLITS